MQPKAVASGACIGRPTTPTPRAAGLRAAGALTGNAERLSSVLEAQWCAENYLSEQSVQRAFPGTGESEFSCEQLGHTYTGRVSVQPMALNPDHRQVIVSMFSDAGVPLATLGALLLGARLLDAVAERARIVASPPRERDLGRLLAPYIEPVGG